MSGNTAPWGDDGQMAVCAVRYCLGRMTYIVGECRRWLEQVWPDLPAPARLLIERDVEEAFERDTRDRERGSTIKTLGWDCDRAEWERVRKLWGKA